jgi:hypothetical protein
MAIQCSDRVANAMLDAGETATGTSPTLEIRTGSKPATCATADSGTVLATMSLPSDWLTSASSRQKLINGTWQDLAADAAGTAGHYRIKGTGGVVDWQGSVTATGGGGDMTLDNPVLAVGQQVTITAFTINGPSA